MKWFFNEPILVCSGVATGNVCTELQSGRVTGTVEIRRKEESKQVQRKIRRLFLCLCRQNYMRISDEICSQIINKNQLRPFESSLCNLTRRSPSLNSALRLLTSRLPDQLCSPNCEPDNAIVRVTVVSTAACDHDHRLTTSQTDVYASTNDVNEYHFIIILASSNNRNYGNMSAFALCIYTLTRHQDHVQSTP